MEGMRTRLFHAESLRDFVSRVFGFYGVPPRDAAVAADVLVTADLRGIDSHGVSRLRGYVDQIIAGKINPRPQVRIAREWPATAQVDGDNGLGLVVAPRANQICVDKAQSAGAATVSVFNSNHYGIAGYYPLQAVECGLIGWSITNSGSLVAPLWGVERMLGTNPIAIAFPCATEPPVVIDFATSATSLGKIELANDQGAELPPYLAIDCAGEMTLDPSQVLNGGALLPLGGTREAGGHKGYGLAAAVDILCGVLGGASWGPFTPQFLLSSSKRDGAMGKGLGHMFGAIRIDSMVEQSSFLHSMDEWVRTMRATKSIPGRQVVIPGVPEHEHQVAREESGIPLLSSVVDDLEGIAKLTSIPLDLGSKAP